jgi:hypothetical protein
MDGLNLLRRARDAGLAVEVEGDKLVIRGPKRAEPVARLLIDHKPEVMAALVPADPPALEAGESDPDPARWRRHYLIRAIRWELSGARPARLAQHVAWGELLKEWHEHHGQRWPTWQCAGCGEPIGGLAALDLADGNRVHIDKLDCLLSFGQRWRDEATAGLQALGLDPPRPAPCCSSSPSSERKR